jgi:hypothetical protein
VLYFLIKDGQTKTDNQERIITNGQSRTNKQERANKNGQSRTGKQKRTIKNGQSKASGNHGYQTQHEKQNKKVQHIKLKR